MDILEQQGCYLKYLFQLAVLIVADLLLIWVLVRQIDPDPSVSIGLLFLVPAVFVLNIVIAIVLAFIKKRYSGVFFINSFISSFLMYFLFINDIDRHQNKRYEIWKFNLKDTTFEITLSKLDTTFNIAHRTDPGSSSRFMYGSYIAKQNEYILMSDTVKLTIRNKFLFGFRNINDSVKLTKVDR
jgi:hypothetical protein